jgi:hypothetical protein
VADIARLDYSRLPAKYQLPSWVTHGGSIVTTEDTDIAEVIKHAWRHFKAHNDPPGLEVTKDGLFGWWGFQVLRPGTRPVREFHVVDGGRQSALAAAWGWYDARLALAERLRSGLGDRLGRSDGLDFWPQCLSWSDEEVAKIERWLSDSNAEMPEVLRV